MNKTTRDIVVLLWINTTMWERGGGVITSRNSTFRIDCNT